jgi:spore maturation protein CgeB
VKFLLVEFWHSHIYAEPFLHRLRELGHEAHAFREVEYFRPAEGPLRSLSSLSARAQNKFRSGPRLARLNRDLRETIKALRPDVLFVFRGSHVLPETLRSARQAGCYVVGWNNDDPFSSRYAQYEWRHFRRGIPQYERLFAYRESNVADFLNAGCQRVSMLRSFYLREFNYPVQRDSHSPYACDVSFIGHWEPDGRERYVQALAENEAIHFRLWGTLWERAPNFGRLRGRLGQIEPAYKESYNLAVNHSKIALVFLSKLNRDTYTRRCFEIPAAETFMLSEYSADLPTLFEEGVEAEYFRSTDEMLEKVARYLSDEQKRLRIAKAGRARLLRDGHEALDRAKHVIEMVQGDLAQRAAASGK